MPSLFDRQLTLDEVKVLTNGLVHLIKCYDRILNCHMVDFITEDHWSSVLDEALGSEVQRLGLGVHGHAEQTIFRLLCCQECVQSDEYPNVVSVVKSIQDFHIDNIAAEIPSTQENNCKNYLDYWWMKKKKNHELQFFSELVSAVVAQSQAKIVVDFGCGKGYLSTLLSLRHNLKVLGLECSESNTNGAQARHGKLVLEYEKADRNFSDAQLNIGQFVTVTETIKPDTNLQTVLSQWIDSDSENKLLLCGLHTCGDLGSTIVQQFVNNSNTKALCYVGCCYHLIQEEFSINPFSISSIHDNTTWGFPLSSYLRDQKIGIGRNARMLSSQSWQRIANLGSLPENRSLFYRAVLQAILKDIGKPPEPSRRVGKLANKCKRFVDYFRSGVQRLNLKDIVISDEQIERHFEKYKDFESKLNVFQGLRVLLSPALEGIIILDRILFLLENETVESCHLFKSFDPKISPRCYAIVAFKKDR